jgi:hypothetical protein
MAPGNPDGVPASPAPRWAWGVFLLALLLHLAAGAVGWVHRVIQDDVSTFRQTQTALSTYWMLGHRYRLDYETPVFGPPWSMPYELPLYQWLVAGLATLTGWSLDPSGRAVAEAFFLLTLMPCWSLLGRLGVEPRERVLALSLLLVSPFYLFWSRAFLIESTALFLALSYLAAAWAFLERPRPVPFVAALALGVLAALVKITTCAAAWLALGLLLPGLLLRSGRGSRAAAWLVLVGVPLAAGVLWTHWADSLKEQNPFARHLTSRALHEWNFGTPGQRWQWQTWGYVLARSPGMARQSIWLAACLLLMPLTRRYRAAVAACIFIHLALPLVFTNLYSMHEYYAFASMVFQVGAVALTVAGLTARGGWRAGLGVAAAAAFVVLACHDYLTEYCPIQAIDHDESAALCGAVREKTGPEDVIIVLGCDWSSEVPYYSRRRALMVPFWKSTPLSDLPRYLELLRGYRTGGLVVRRAYVGDQQLEDALRDLRDYGLVVQPAFEDEVFTLYTLRPARE